MNRKSRIQLWAFIFLLLLLFFLSLNIGSYSISPINILKTLISAFFPSSLSLPTAYADILFRIRVPRLLLALLVGMSLSVSGASLQALFKNPLVNEFILGLSSGAAFGAALSIVFLGKSFPPQVAAFVFAVGAVLAVLLVAGRSDTHIVTLILTGVIVSSFFSALLSLLEFFASPYALQSLFFWLMGSLSMATWKDVIFSVPLMLTGVVIMLLLRWRLNILSMSDEQVKALGINVRMEKILVIAAATMATAAATSVAGIIGWVGLIVPHLVRMMVGADSRLVIPFSAVMGSIFILLADDLTRGLTSFEIPIGIFTSLIGIPLFVFLLKKSKKVWL